MAEPCECHQEVADLHRFFQDWFQGVLPVEDFDRCDAALAPGFTIVTPGGELIERADIIEALRLHHGGEPSTFAIETVARHCQRVGELHLTTYEERQAGARSTVRLSTAVLSQDRGLFRWHAVQETWITV
jgi:hypothetical protein